MTDSNETVRLGNDALAARERADAGALLVVDAKGPGAATVSLERGATVTVGRDAGGCDVVVEDPSLSREHARFTCGDGLVVVDLGSTNGTRVNGVALAPHTPQPLAAGDEVVLGAVVVAVHAAVGPAHRRLLVAHEKFLATVDDEVARARIFARNLALVLLRGPNAATHLVTGALRVLRPVDRVAAYAPDLVELLLVETDAAGAADVAARIGGAAAVAIYPTDGTSRDALYEAALASVGAKTAKPSTTAAAATLLALSSSASAKMKELSGTVDKVARTAIPVLIVGETGAGKEVVAREIHARSSRKAAPFVSVNCGAIPSSLIESTLFGHERGAFTGASETKAGVFEAGRGGTVFLDEIGELSAAAQTALLRVLESKRVTRVGANAEIEIDARLLAATHRDLDAMVAQGAFRQDLLYRLNAMTLFVPPLRDRTDEILPLARSFVSDANARHGRTCSGFNDDAAEALLAYRWPGNVRELRNAIERAVVIAAGDVVDVEDLPEALRRPSALVEMATSGASGGSARATGTGATLGERLEKIEAQLILDALDKNEQSVAATATALGMPKRTLQHRMKLLGISRKATYAR